MIPNKSEVFITLVVSIIIHCLLEILFPSMYGDQYMQINSFYNFIDGNGVSLNIVYPDDLSKFKYEQLNLWPFGFIMLNLPLGYFFQSIGTSTLILNVLFILLFFISVYKILNLNSEFISEKSKVIILLFFAIAIMPSRYMGSTDLWCLGLLFFALYNTLKLIYFKDIEFKRQIFISFLISISILLMVSLRYTYWILAFSFPLILMLYSISINKKFLKISIITSLLSFLFAICYVFFHYKYFGKINPTSLNATKNIDWSALKVYNPLYFNTLFRDSIVRNFFVKAILNPYSLIIFQLFAQIISFMIGIVVFKSLYKKLKLKLKPKFSFEVNKYSIFVLSALIIIILNNVTIIMAAIKYGYLFVSELYPLGYTTVAEVRYFAPTLVILFIYLVIAIQYSENRIISSFLKLVLYSGFCFALIINLLLISARFDKPIIPLPKHLHTYSHNEVMYSLLKSNYKNSVYLPSPYADLKDYYMATYAHMPEVRNADWGNLNLKSSKKVSIVTLNNTSDTTLKKYNPKILIQSLKPDIDLVEITLNPNI